MRDRDLRLLSWRVGCSLVVMSRRVGCSLVVTSIGDRACMIPKYNAATRVNCMSTDEEFVDMMRLAEEIWRYLPTTTLNLHTLDALVKSLRV